MITNPEIQNVPTTKTTIKNFATAQDIDYLTASAVMKFFVKVGIAKETNEKEPKPEGTRGKPSSIFEVENEVELVLYEDGNEMNSDRAGVILVPEVVSLEPITIIEEKRLDNSENKT